MPAVVLFSPRSRTQISDCLVLICWRELFGLRWRFVSVPAQATRRSRGLSRTYLQCRSRPPRTRDDRPNAGTVISRSQPLSCRARASISLDRPSMRSSSRRQSPARSSVTRNMRGDRASQGAARMCGNSLRKKRKPCRTATPRSNRKARISAGGESDGDLPVPVQKACEHARVYDDAGSVGLSRKRRLPCCLLSVQRTSAPRTWLTPLNTWPAHSPVNASLAASRLHAHDLGSVWLATPCTVTDFHRLPSAGLPAHPGLPITGSAMFYLIIAVSQA